VTTECYGYTVTPQELTELTGWLYLANSSSLLAIHGLCLRLGPFAFGQRDKLGFYLEQEEFRKYICESSKCHLVATNILGDR
jgi:hypothetical protein